MVPIRLGVAAAAIAFAVAGLAANAEPPGLGGAGVRGEKLDNGLGDIPHYRHWASRADLRGMANGGDRIVGEKLDSGLGELPPYALWAERHRERRGIELVRR